MQHTRERIDKDGSAAAAGSRASARLRRNGCIDGSATPSGTLLSRMLSNPKVQGVAACALLVWAGLLVADVRALRSSDAVKASPLGK